MFTKLKGPIQVQWEVTPCCNHLCLHCYNYWRKQGRSSNVKPSTRSLRIYESAVKNIINNEVFAVTITGGEPLMVIDHVLPHLEQLHNSRISLGMNTNLTLITKSLAQKIIDVGIKTVLTSLLSYNPNVNDKLTNTPGSQELILRGIKTAQDSGLKVSVNMVVTKENLGDVYQTAQFVSSLGINSFSATKVATPGNARDFSSYRLSQKEFHFMLLELVRARDAFGLDIDSLEFYPQCSFPNPQVAKIFGSRMCTAGKTSCTIGFDGNVRPCSHAPMSYGLIEDGLSNAWEKLNPWRTDENLPNGCINCPIRYLCAGGCKAEAYVSTGSLKSVDPYCQVEAVEVKRIENAQSNLDENRSFEVVPELRVRTEEFGGILFGSKRKWLPADIKLFTFISERTGKSFSQNDLAQGLDVEPRLLNETLSVLKAKNIVTQVNVK